jgi:hypothetical protein
MYRGLAAPILAEAPKVTIFAPSLSHASLTGTLGLVFAACKMRPLIMPFSPPPPLRSSHVQRAVKFTSNEYFKKMQAPPFRLPAPPPLPPSLPAGTWACLARTK